MSSESSKREKLVVIILAGAVLFGLIFIIQHWNEFQREVSIPDETSALVRVFVGHYLMLGIMRSSSILIILLLLVALCVVIVKVHLATELKTSFFALKEKRREIEDAASAQDNEIENLKNKLEEYQLRLLIKDSIINSLRKE